MRILSFWMVLLLLAVAGRVSAQSQTPTVTYGTLGGTINGGAITTASSSDFNRLINAGTTSGDVVVRDGVKARVGARDVDMVLNRTMPWQQVGKAATLIGKTIPYVATGIAFMELMDTLRARSNGTVWSQDAGVNPTTGPNWCNRGSSSSALSLTASCGFTSAAASIAPFVAASNPACLNASSRDSGAYSVITSETSTRVYFKIMATRTTWPSNSNCTGTGVPALIEVFTSDNYVAGTTTSCPASIDAVNPANSLPAGLPVGYDGKCRTGRYNVPLSDTAAENLAVNSGDKTRAVPTVVSLTGRGLDLVPYTQTPTATGPGTVSQPATTTTTTGPNGTTTGTTTPTTVITYSGPSYTWNDSTVITSTTGGVTTTTTTVAPPTQNTETCGLPGKPACKIDEAGTPPMGPVVDPTVGQVADDAARRTAADAQLTDPAFGWFSAPPVVTCTPFEWPGGFSLNPCGPMEIVRSIMAYLWAIFAAWWSFGIVRRTVAGA